MQKYRTGSHTRYDIKFHIVWITKYRKPVLRGEISIRVRDILREICLSMDVEIIKGHVSSDHIHMFVSVPPSLSVSKLVQKLKGSSSRKLLMEYNVLKKKFWGSHLWARGYFVASSGNITDEMIMEYIEGQDIGVKEGDFTVGY